MDDNQTQWWRATARLAAIVLSGFVVIVCLPLLFAGWLDRGTLLALPITTFLIVLVAPCALAVAIFWFADRQRALDRGYRVIED